MSQKRTIEEVYEMTVLSGSTGNSIRFTPPTGRVERMVVDYNTGAAIPNTGFVKTYLNDSSGVEIIKPQGIRNLRSRDVAYECDGKVVNLDTDGKTFVWVINSDVAFSANFLVTLILRYQIENENCELKQ